MISVITKLVNNINIHTKLEKLEKLEKQKNKKK
jgi:hypothetical protein